VIFLNYKDRDIVSISKQKKEYFHIAMTQQEKVRYWLDKASDDIDSARIMYDSSKYLYTGFMCQQCIEKALKGAYIHLNNERHPHEHNLDKLAKMTRLFDSMDDRMKLILEKLDPLYIATRYDDYKDKMTSILTRPYCMTLLKETEELLSWIKKSMK
jgi:HEPN domain-containing protein